MQKSLTVALAAAGLLAASQVSFANALAPSSGTESGGTGKQPDRARENGRRRWWWRPGTVVAAVASGTVVAVVAPGTVVASGTAVAEWAMASAWVTGPPEDTGQ